MRLSDCGREIIATYDWGNNPIQVKVIMVIKAPRGVMALFDKGDQDKQCLGIKYFMEEHAND